MSTSRRTFLKSSAMSLAATAFFKNQLFANTAAKPVFGIQLYTVRQDMQKDPSGTLKQLQAIGYVYVEHANYVNRKFYGYAPADFKKLLDDLGMKMHSGHTVMGKNHWDVAKNDFTDAWKYTVDDAATAGQKYVISPWLDQSMRQTYEDFKRYMDVFNKSGELCKRHGMKFGYHNHDFEFSNSLNGVVLYDLILQNTDPALVAQQLDMGNLYNGGAKAIDIAKKFPGRFELMHVKDEIPSTSKEEKYESTILGKGIVNTKEIVDIGKTTGGTRYFIIEQESYQGKTPLQCAKEDYDIMKGWGF